MDTTHHPTELLTDSVNGACTPAEATMVRRHVAGCPSCAALLVQLRRAASWLGADPGQGPPPRLRSAVLAAALSARPREAFEVYAVQSAAFADLLDRLSPGQWLAPIGRYRSTQHLVAHLAANDAPVVAGLGLAPAPTTARPAERWRRQAADLVAGAERAEPAVLSRQVRLAGRAGLLHPVRGALVQRAFETWIHADDIRLGTGRPAMDPDGEQLRQIVAFACLLLPGALDAAGHGRPGQAIGLALTGPGGQERTVALSAAYPPPCSAAPVATVLMSTVDFCRLLADRCTPETAGVVVDGDVRAATDFLAVARTMGCD